MFSYRGRKLIFELSKRSTGKYLFKLEMLLRCSEVIGGAGLHPTTGVIPKIG
jgi:hypothetical protein